MSYVGPQGDFLFLVELLKKQHIQGPTEHGWTTRLEKHIFIPFGMKMDELILQSKVCWCPHVRYHHLKFLFG